MIPVALHSWPQRASASTSAANAATLRQVASFAPGSTLAMTFVLPIALSDPAIRPHLQLAEKGARASFAGRNDGLKPPVGGEEILVATV